MLDPDHSLTRLSWTDQEFAAMPWHDCTIYTDWSDNTNVDLLMDMDELCAGVQPAGANRPQSFYVAPATLAFHGAMDIQFSLGSVATPFKRNAVRREDPHALLTLRGRLHAVLAPATDAHARTVPLLRGAQRYLFHPRRPAIERFPATISASIRSPSHGEVCSGAISVAASRAPVVALPQSL
jgi:hypothetical protein